MDLQAWLPASLAALHNFILDHDPQEHIECDLIDPVLEAHLNPAELLATQGELSTERRTDAESEEGWQLREEIAQAMWIDYVAICEQQSLAEELEISEDNGDNGDMETDA